MATTMCAAGAVLVLLGAGVAIRSALLLRGYGRPRRGPQPRFVIAGPYRRLRNPILAGTLMAVAGVACAIRSPGLAVATLLAFVCAHVWVVAVEEPALGTAFGDAYAAYRCYVPRWIPRRIHANDERSAG